MLVNDWTSLWDKKTLELEINDLFTNFLVSVTIQDGNKRERSNSWVFL